MKKIITLSIHDFQMIFRDRILMVILFIPFIMLSVLYWGMPLIMDFFSIEDTFYPLIVGVLCVVTAISPAYVVSFIMLDEKDEGIFTVMRIMPLPPMVFITYRILFVLVFGFLSSFVTLFVAGLQLSIPLILIYSFLMSLIAPITVLVIVTFARNKIEGLTFLKGINFLIILPVMSFFLGKIGKFFFAIVPTFWIYHSLMNSYFLRCLYLGIGFIFYLLLFLILITQFKKRILN